MVLKLLMCIFLIGFFSYVAGDSQYGPYELYFTEVQDCRSPKTRNLTQNAYVIRKRGNDTFLSVNVNITETTKIEMMKMSIFLAINNVNSTMMKYRAKNPCSHQFFGFLLEKVFEFTGSCSIKPGVYMKDLNIPAISKKLYSSLLYGYYVNKVEVSNRKGNIGCLVAHFTVAAA